MSSTRDEVLEIFTEAQSFGRRPRWRLAIEYGEPRHLLSAEPAPWEGQGFEQWAADEAERAKLALERDRAEREARYERELLDPAVRRANARRTAKRWRRRIDAELRAARVSLSYPTIGILGRRDCDRCGGVLELRLGVGYLIHLGRCA